jgi:hypothetical protein
LEPWLRKQRGMKIILWMKRNKGVAKFNKKGKVSSKNSIPKDCLALLKKLKMHISMDLVT